MKIESPDFIYEVLPPYGKNRTNEVPVKEKIVIGLKAVSTPIADKFELEKHSLMNTYATDKAMAMIQESSHALVKKHFAFIKGLEIGGREIKTFEEFRGQAPKTIYDWVCAVIKSTQALDEAQLKNFLPLSDSTSEKAEPGEPAAAEK